MTPPAESSPDTPSSVRAKSLASGITNPPAGFVPVSSMIAAHSWFSSVGCQGHTVTAIGAPGLATRRSSATHRSGCPAWFTAKFATTAANASSPYGSRASSPTSNRAPGTRSRANETMLSSASTPVTCQPCATASAAATPVPHPASRSASPGAPGIPTASSSAGTAPAHIRPNERS